MSVTLGRRRLLYAGAVAAWTVGCGGHTAAKRIALPARKRRLPLPPGDVKSLLARTVSAPSPEPKSTKDPVIVDMHCHAFNALDVPIDGFVRSLAQGAGMPAMLDGALAVVTRRFHRALVNATPAKGRAA